MDFSLPSHPRGENTLRGLTFARNPGMDLLSMITDQLWFLRRSLFQEPTPERKDHARKKRLPAPDVCRRG